MGRTRGRAGAAGGRLCAGLLLAAAAAAAEPAVVRPHLVVGDQRRGAGSAFFVATPDGRRVAAVGTAHAFPLTRLTEATAVEFRDRDGARVHAVAQRLLAGPGRPYADVGATFADDFHLYALEAPPEGIEVLELETQRPPRFGDPVEILGLPTRDAPDGQRLRGRVAAVTPIRLEVELEGSHDLSGWGGAPLLAPASRRVVGVLQAVRSEGDGTTVVAGPVTRIASALQRPLARGRGRPFGDYAELASLLQPRDPSRGPEPLLRQTPETPGVDLELEYPPEGGRVGDLGCGAFVAGRAEPGELRRYDVVFALDTSASTHDGTGADINGNGVVGKRSVGAFGSLRSVEHTDPGDSIVAAEVAAARQLLRGLDPRSTRVAVVAFAGQDPRAEVGGLRGLASAFGETRRHAETLKPLTRDYHEIERALEQILSLTPDGQTHIAAGLDQAITELLALRGALSSPGPKSEKVVFLFTDGTPTLPYSGRLAANVQVVLDAADRARRAGITIHSFAIGPEALAGPITAVEMASRTGGFFTPVRHPGDLVDAVEVVDLPRLRDLYLVSETLERDAEPFLVHEDGSWAGFVPAQPGRNRARAHARASDGTESTRTVSFELSSNAAATPIPKALAPRRNALLEECLEILRSRRADAQQVRAEQLRRKLRIEIERERERAEERADQQRRELQLEIE